MKVPWENSSPLSVSSPNTILPASAKLGINDTLSEDLCIIALNGLGKGNDVRLCELDSGLWTSGADGSGTRGRSLNCCTKKCPFVSIEKKEIVPIIMSHWPSGQNAYQAWYHLLSASRYSPSPSTDRSMYHCPSASSLGSYDPCVSPGNKSNITTRVRYCMVFSFISDAEIVSVVAQASNIVDYIVYVHAKGWMTVNRWNIACRCCSHLSSVQYA
jgi:hypothetical protein